MIQRRVSPSTTLHIDIIVDLACPWCYIGFCTLQKAIRNLTGEFNISHRWLPFELFPLFPLAGMERTRHMISVFGSRARMQRVFDNVTATAHSEGLAIHFEKINRSVNTFPLHRLVWKAAQSGQQDEVALTLFNAFFTDGKDLSSTAVIIEVMKSVGWSQSRTTDFLNSGEGVSELIAIRQNILPMNISAVPHYRINYSYGISGAQSVSLFETKLRELATTRNTIISTYNNFL